MPDHGRRCAPRHGGTRSRSSVHGLRENRRKPDGCLTRERARSGSTSDPHRCRASRPGLNWSQTVTMNRSMYGSTESLASLPGSLIPNTSSRRDWNQDRNGTSTKHRPTPSVQATIWLRLTAEANSQLAGWRFRSADDDEGVATVHEQGKRILQRRRMTDHVTCC